MGSPDGRGIPVGFGLPPFGGRTSRELWAMAQLPTARNSVHRSASPQAARNTSVSGGPFGPGVVSLGSPAQWTRAAAQGQAGEISASHNSATAAAAEQDDPTTIERKVKILLNKLTERRFDSISDQIIQWANLSEKETDGKTLTQVVNLVFEKAINDVTSSEMYARLCRKMMEQISPDVQDEGITNAEGHPIAGGQPFRKYLLNLCQEHFEKGWLARGVAAAAVAEDKILDDKAKKDAAEGKAPQEVLHSQEYYKAQKIKRQGLGLVKFIAELFKLQILTERIMHECIKKLLLNIDDPEEGEIESLCWLLVTVGRALDTSKARNHMDVYFIRMNDLAQNESINPRIQQMLQVRFSPTLCL
jgi:translation initiation factor 4G